ncbi:MAG TPA: PLP-dependent aminotransferase family protein [Vicinamibacterales bacterium]|nr:PLP-dependent aminotransferase family protein [Vicinamibacterales bacterium]
MINYDDFLSRAAERMKESAIRKMGTVLAQARDIISFAPGYPAPETFAWGDFQEIARDLLSGRDGSVLQYGPTRGFPALLEAIAGIMSQRNVRTELDRLVVTTGSQQGLDLVARVLLDPGDVVLVELPTYTGAITAFRNVQAQMVGVRQDPDGIDLDALDETFLRLQREGRRVRVLYVVPNFQNPTGLLIGREKRLELLSWAGKRNVLLVEDDPYRDLYFEDSTTEEDVRPIRADDEDGRVVYMSSFSKTLAPGFRVAWIETAAPLAAKFEVAKQAADLCTSGLDQRIVYEACRRGVLERQIPVLRAHYRHKRDVMVDALRRELGTDLRWPQPRGGFFLWATLPSGIDADAMIQRAVQHGVIYVAGEAFFVDGGGRDIMRLSFSAPTPQRIEEGVRRLAAVIRDEQAAKAPARPARTASAAGGQSPAEP